MRQEVRRRIAVKTPQPNPQVQTGKESIPNQALSRPSDGSARADLGDIMKQRIQQQFLDHQIPAAEQEADHLAAGAAGVQTMAQVKTQMGEKMGADFSPVQFHTGPAAAAVAKQMGARAYTSGKDVYFGEGGFDPAVAAHELVHTAQQGAVASGVETISAPAGEVQMKPDIKRRLGNIDTILSNGADKVKQKAQDGLGFVADKTSWCALQAGNAISDFKDKAMKKLNIAAPSAASAAIPTEAAEPMSRRERIESKLDEVTEPMNSIKERSEQVNSISGDVRSFLKKRKAEKAAAPFEKVGNVTGKVNAFSSLTGNANDTYKEGRATVESFKAHNYGEAGEHMLNAGSSGIGAAKDAAEVLDTFGVKLPKQTGSGMDLANNVIDTTREGKAAVDSFRTGDRYQGGIHTANAGEKFLEATENALDIADKSGVSIPDPVGGVLTMTKDAVGIVTSGAELYHARKTQENMAVEAKKRQGTNQDVADIFTQAADQNVVNKERAAVNLAENVVSTVGDAAEIGGVAGGSEAGKLLGHVVGKVASVHVNDKQAAVERKNMDRTFGTITDTKSLVREGITEEKWKEMSVAERDAAMDEMEQLVHLARGTGNRGDRALTYIGDAKDKAAMVKEAAKNGEEWANSYLKNAGIHADLDGEFSEDEIAKSLAGNDMEEREEKARKSLMTSSEIMLEEQQKKQAEKKRREQSKQADKLKKQQAKKEKDEAKKDPKLYAAWKDQQEQAKVRKQWDKRVAKSEQKEAKEKKKEHREQVKKARKAESATQKQQKEEQREQRRKDIPSWRDRRKDDYAEWRKRRHIVHEQEAELKKSDADRYAYNTNTTGRQKVKDTLTHYGSELAKPITSMPQKLKEEKADLLQGNSYRQLSTGNKIKHHIQHPLAHLMTHKARTAAEKGQNSEFVEQAYKEAHQEKGKKGVLKDIKAFGVQKKLEEMHGPLDKKLVNLRHVEKTPEQREEERMARIREEYLAQKKEAAEAEERKKALAEKGHTDWKAAQPSKAEAEKKKEKLPV